MNRNFFRRLSDSFFASVPIQERVNFARHLSVVIKSGVPLIEGLKLIQGQSSSKRLSKIIEAVIRDVNNGQSLAKSLERFDYIFGDFFISMVRVGETSGNLSQSLLYLSDELKKQKELQHQVKSALIYPAVILVVTIGITVFLTLFIFPKILPIFVSLKIQLPFTTRAVIAFLTFLTHYGVIFLGSIIFFLIFLKAILMTHRVHLLFDRFAIRVPFVGGVIMNVTMANFSRSLSVLLKSGMTLIDALEIVKGTFHNTYYRAQIEGVVEFVRRGEEMAEYLARHPKLFPSMLVGMIRVGESTGNLEENLLHLSEYYETEVTDTVKNLTTVLEPLLLVVMGLMVGFIALSIITPIYKITQEIKLK